MKKNLKFNWQTKRFVMEDGNPKLFDDESAAEAWVEQVIRTDKGSLLYPERYGTITKELVGKRALNQFYKSELERTIKESCKENQYIDRIENIQVNSDGTIEFSLYLKKD